MPPNTTLWPIGVHTPGKHLVLRAYLNAWLPILGMTQGRIVFIDGFAGPGAYLGGEDGSPIIAIRALNEHVSKNRISAEVAFVFVESDPDRAANLERIVNELRPSMPTNASIHVHRGAFDETLSDLLDTVGASGKILAPAFVMVDPFGVSDTPMSLLSRILQNPRSELYISFMYEAINRFKTSPEFGPHLDALFGTTEWRNGIEMPESDARRKFFYDLYTRQLKDAGAKHVVRFELFEGNRHVYTIFFATKSHVGCDRMKQAIWSVSPGGEFAFRGSRSGQLSLLESLGPNREYLRREIRAKFGGQGAVDIKKMIEWVSGDETDFHSGHLKSTLKEMEQQNELTAVGPPEKRRRSGTFAPGTMVTVL